MGQEIASKSFTKKDFARFEERLGEEMALLGRWFEEGAWERTPASIGGFELEAWLVDRECRPAPINEVYLERLASPLVVPELARFNVELNTAPRPLGDAALSAMERELADTWALCNRVAGEMDLCLGMVGILPSVTEQDLCRANMSSMKRYAALTEQVLRLRQGRPLMVEIRGHEHLRWAQWDVMLESAATSFQVHLQVDPARAVRFYNASIILSGPMVAATANSPFLFGKDLWEETRIPLFEQAVASAAGGGAPNRVTFGTGYAKRSLYECFVENMEAYPVLLPMVMDRPAESLAHVRLHNGTIWRWNRPLIGTEGQVPHLRIEHRVIPAGPSVPDAIANAALYFAAVHLLAQQPQPPEAQIPFETARENFYRCARQGLDARITWLDGKDVNVRALLLEEILPRGGQTLRAMGLAAEEVARYLGIVRERLASGRTGAAWQRAYAARHGADMRALTCAYLERGRSGLPVHEWVV
jgi:gamma-glutamyl:cysteine ligase YbdK (ATP-grasp superfamily)